MKIIMYQIHDMFIILIHMKGGECNEIKKVKKHILYGKTVSG